MPRVGLDEKDTQILESLRRNSRMTNTLLAKEVGLTPTPCRLRVKRLEEIGYIKRYTIEIDAAAETQSTKFVHVSFDRQQDHIFRQVIDILPHHPSVTYAALTEGESDFVLRIDEKNDDRVASLIHELTQMSEVKHVRTSTVIEEINLRQKK